MSQLLYWYRAVNGCCGYRVFLNNVVSCASPVHSEEALFLLATCYYRSGKAYKAYHLLKGHSCTTPQCKYLLAKCCVDLSKLAEGEQILAGGVLNKQKSQDDIVTEFGDSACFTLALLGQIYCKTDRLARGSECYQKSLGLNPFLWSPFESLCQIGEKPDPEQVFRLTSVQPIHTPSHSVAHRQVDTVLMETPQDTLELNRLNLESSNPKYSSLNTDSSMSYIDSSVISPDSVPLGTSSSLLSKQAPNKPKSGRSLLSGPAALSPLTPSFGILPLEPSPGDSSYLQNFTNTGSMMDSAPPGGPPKKVVLLHSLSISPSCLLHGFFTTPQVLSPTIAAPPNIQPRRSSRLFTSASSTAKENSKKLKMKFPPKIPNRKTKTKTSKGGMTPSNMNESLEILKLDSSIVCDGKGSMMPPQFQAFNLQKAVADGLMSLMRDIGKGFLALCSYNCKEAISILSQLPSHHYNTGWVLSQIGRAHFELAEYMQSWCAAGNCFSLQREHDIAIKFFQRAIQVDPSFAYAYTLLGHEFVLTEELEKALACFRNAIRVNTRHYNAWYGLGMIYYKQEKFNLAEIHFKKALSIHPQSSVLLCHIGVVQHALKKSDHALETLNKAIGLDPKNPLCKFHRASILFANEKYKAALQELEELKQIVPKESLVYFLIGKVYKKLGQTHLALMNFSWAMDLDPKGANNQIKEAIDKRYLPDDEEPVTADDFPYDSAEAEESQESSMTDAEDAQLHTAEGDEVF
ncbi:cell division cycle protein 27-like [Scleropages formosus]|uniref:Cell division cycle protein 27 homolog n=1 Tax=Scleropages formosus TaxID=113540 RepID=A0A0P7XPP1_SCLFO|nr:cell division cycle protein 27-like [Scleropages formosus]